MNFPRYEKRCVCKVFVKFNEMIDFINHDRIRKDDIVSINSFPVKDNYEIYLTYYKIVEVRL